MLESPKTRKQLHIQLLVDYLCLVELIYTTFKLKTALVIKLLPLQTWHRKTRSMKTSTLFFGIFLQAHILQLLAVKCTIPEPLNNGNLFTFSSNVFVASFKTLTPSSAILFFGGVASNFQCDGSGPSTTGVGTEYWGRLSATFAGNTGIAGSCLRVTPINSSTQLVGLTMRTNLTRLGFTTAFAPAVYPLMNSAGPTTQAESCNAGGFRPDLEGVLIDYTSGSFTPTECPDELQWTFTSYIVNGVNCASVSDIASGSGSQFRIKTDSCSPAAYFFRQSGSTLHCLHKFTRKGLKYLLFSNSNSQPTATEYFCSLYSREGSTLRLTIAKEHEWGGHGHCSFPGDVNAPKAHFIFTVPSCELPRPLSNKQKFSFLYGNDFSGTMIAENRNAMQLSLDSLGGTRQIDGRFACGDSGPSITGVGTEYWGRFYPTLSTSIVVICFRFTTVDSSSTVMGLTFRTEFQSIRYGRWIYIPMKLWSDNVPSLQAFACDAREVYPYYEAPLLAHSQGKIKPLSCPAALQKTFTSYGATSYVAVTSQDLQRYNCSGHGARGTNESFSINTTLCNTVSDFFSARELTFHCLNGFTRDNVDYVLVVRSQQASGPIEHFCASYAVNGKQLRVTMSKEQCLATSTSMPNQGLNSISFVLKECPRGTYGRRCDLTCHCAGDNECDVRSGRCKSDECQLGWYGPTCQIENVALNRTTYLSSGSSMIVLNSTGCIRLPNTSVTQLLDVNLGRSVHLEYVWIHTNPPQNTSNNQATVITVADESSTNVPCIVNITPHLPKEFGSQWTCGVKGRSVRITRTPASTDPLEVCDIVASSLPVRKPASERVRNLRIESSNGSSVLVTWKAPDWTYLTLESYIVALYSKGGIACPSTSSELKDRVIVRPYDTTNRAAFYHLFPFTQYEIRVQGQTFSIEGGGLGLESVLLHNTSAKAVSPDSIIPMDIKVSSVTPYSFILQWTTPPCHKWGSPFHSYVIALQDSQNRSLQNETYLLDNSADNTYKLEGLEPDTEYMVSLYFRTFNTTSAAATLAQKTLVTEFFKTTVFYIGLGVAALVIVGLIGLSVYLVRRRRRRPERLDFNRDIPLSELEKKYDVFLSYKCGGSDETFCSKKLLPKLEKNGYKVVLHSRDFIPGKEIANNILDAVKNSKTVVLIISKGFCRSEWCRFEYQAAQVEMLQMQTKIVPILLEDIDELGVQDNNLKHILDSVTYIRWTPDETAQDEEWKLLLSALPSVKPNESEIRNGTNPFQWLREKLSSKTR